MERTSISGICKWFVPKSPKESELGRARSTNRGTEMSLREDMTGGDSSKRISHLIK